MIEVVLGLGLASLIFLIIIGVNVIPLVLVAMLLAFFYFFMQNQGYVKFTELGKGATQNSRVGFDDIGGQETAVNELKEALQFIVKPEEIFHMGIRPLRGVLLVGPPGTGKTLMAKAAASYTGSAFMAASGSEFIEVYAGVGAKRIRKLFSDARKRAQNEKKRSAIIFIDELDILGAKRGSHSSHMEYDQTLNQLLVEMDGISSGSEPYVLLVGATNRADMLDPALLRPGRFDRQVQVGLPDKVGRKKILEIHTRNKPVNDIAILDEIARATFGFSGAHLESLANEAAILALREEATKIDSRHFREAIDKVIMGEKLDRRPSPEEMERVSIHESGHALVSEMLEPGSVSSLTIIPRGKALGFMRKSPQDDQYLYTREQMEKQIMVMLAGAVAEEIKFGNRSTGARSDFNQAWKLSREIVEAGLSSLGIISGDDVPGETLYRECHKIISNLEEATLELLGKMERSLLNLARSMVEEETIDRERFLQFVCKPKPQAIQICTLYGARP
ncbi:AAA family ATPase [Syntrophomonas curvata]